ncbi:MAG: hypothetical protein WEA09_11255 [Gemmatimonadota bacterium]
MPEYLLTRPGEDDNESAEGMPDPTGLLIGVRNDSGALERVLGLLRRKDVSILRLSFSLGEDGAWRMTLRTGQPVEKVARLAAEVANLSDVTSVRSLPLAGGAGSRELALVRVEGPPPLPAGTIGRLLRTDPWGSVLEFVGSPGEVSAQVARLREAGLRPRMIRSGEVPDPGPSSPRDPEVPPTK